MKLLSELKKAKPIDYNQLPTRLFAATIAAHLIISFDEPESIVELLQMPEYYEALVINTAMAAAIVELINWVTRGLDRTKSWIFHPWKRLLAQFIEGIILPLSLSIVLAIAYFAIYSIHIKETVFFPQYFLIIILMVILANAYYFMHLSFWVIITMLKLNKKERVVRKLDMPAELKDLWPTTDIAMIQTENEEYFVTTSKGERLTWPDTLETTIDNLPYEDYFLINRSTIMNIDNISNAMVSSSRRFTLTLKVPTDMEVDVSQRYAKGCKQWLELNKIKIR